MEYRTVNLRDWLEERGALKGYVKAYTENDNIGFGAPFCRDAASLIYWSFPWDESEEGFKYWNELDDLWRRECLGLHSIIFGMPLTDPLAMALLKAELEAGDS